MQTTVRQIIPVNVGETVKLTNFEEICIDLDTHLAWCQLGICTRPFGGKTPPKLELNVWHCKMNRKEGVLHYASRIKNRSAHVADPGVTSVKNQGRSNRTCWTCWARIADNCVGRTVSSTEEVEPSGFIQHRTRHPPRSSSHVVDFNMRDLNGCIRIDGLVDCE